MAESITYAEIDKKRKNNTADSCYFYVPANDAGELFLTSLRMYLNQSCFRMRTKNRGKRHDYWNDVFAKDRTHYSVYFDVKKKSKQTLEIESYRKRLMDAGHEHGKCSSLLARATEANYQKGITLGAFDAERRILSLGFWGLIRWYFKNRKAVNHGN